ncbi:MAG: glutathione S-transferase family protein [Gammaproteobacteria bacterium]|nr:glutathione S-transferase family protein [Gammaproteobacteria bacterium]
MTDFVVFGTPMSPFVRKVEVVLHEKGLPYDFEAVNIMAKPDWFLAISPIGRIPVLRDRRRGNEGVSGTIPDSSAICAFLEADTPVPGLYPKDPYTLGRALWMEEYADSEMAATVGFNLFRPILFPRMQGKPSDLETARKTWQEKLPRLFDYMEAQLNGRTWLAGDVMTIADIALSCQMTNLDLVAGLPDVTRWPALVAHTRRMAARPSFKANLETCVTILSGIRFEKVDLG